MRRKLNPPTPARHELMSPGLSQVTSHRVDLANQNLLDEGKKIYNDPIHTTIKMDMLCQQIIDTCEYQRLAHLKQLGTCSYVFRGATHSRFEHSLGVAHLAERVARSIKENQPELDINDLDVLCVKVAGLCHDLGHGPFSHVYDGVFIPRMRQDKWRHEDGSVSMFRHLLVQNKIRLSEFGINDKDQVFIEEIIGGTKEEDRKGRAADKFFLYDIVNNTRSGLDVDKLDYFQRDMRYANVTFAANYERFIELGRVLKAQPLNYVRPTLGSTVARLAGGGAAAGGGAGSLLGYSSSQMSDDCHALPEDTEHWPLMICYPEKLVTEAIDMFSVRFRMHKQVYTHKGVKQVEFMICDALMKADPYIRVRGAATDTHPDGLYRISECIEDMTALSRLNDNILEVIRQDPRPELDDARELLVRLDRRRLYSCMGKSPFPRSNRIVGMSEEQIKTDICDIANRLASREGGGENDGEYLESIEESSNEDEDGGAGGRHFDHIGGSYSNLSQLSNASTSATASLTPVERDDIIVEKMHIHYGLKDKNPVGRMRFYKRKASREAVGREVKEASYTTSLPAVFEEQAVRIFCRSEDKGKKATVQRAFNEWCKEARVPTPFPALSQEEPEANLSS